MCSATEGQCNVSDIYMVIREYLGLLADSGRAVKDRLDLAQLELWQTSWIELQLSKRVMMHEWTRVTAAVHMVCH